MYSIYLTEKSRKFLSKLNKPKTEMILKHIYRLRTDPFPYVKRLHGRKLWRLRIEKYRAVLDIIIAGRKIIVVRIGHKSNIYDKI